MGRPSKEKGKRGEREVRDVFREAGIKADRTAPLQAARVEGEADVRIDIPGYHIEVKRTETINVPSWLKQVEEACANGEEPIIAFRRNGDDWLAIVNLKELVRLMAVEANRESD